MGQNLFPFAVLLALAGTTCPLAAQDSPPARITAERVLSWGGQVELLTAANEPLIARRVEDLPPGPWRLIRIDLCGKSRVTDADLKSLEPCPDVQELNLNYTRITDAGLKTLDRFPALAKLYLAETSISDEGLTFLAGQKQLTSLDLSGTPVTPEGVKRLSQLAELARLFLGRIPQTSESLTALAKLPKLSGLHLAGVPLKAESLSALAGMSRLEELSLTTDNAGLVKLAELSSLKDLSIYGTGVSDSGLESLAKLPHLEQLRFGQTAITERGLNRLREALKDCRVVAHPLSRQSAFLSGLLSGDDLQRPVLRWTPGEEKDQWPGLIPRPAALPGIRRWQVETVGPRSEIFSVDFSPNGTLIACGTAAGFVRIYEADTLRLVRLIPAHPRGVNAVAWSPDGTKLASAGIDGLIKLWNADGQELRVLRGHRGNVLTVEWNHDGQWLASGGWDGIARVWKADGTTSKELKGHTKGVMAVAFSPDGKQLATGSNDATLRLWKLDGPNTDAEAGANDSIELKGHTDVVVALAWSSNGSRLASGSWDRTIRFWNPRTGRGGPVLEGHTYRIFDLEWHPNGTMLASTGDRTLRLWTLDGTPVRTVKTEGHEIRALSWKHDGSEIAIGTRNDSLLRVINLTSNAERTIGEATAGGVGALAWHPDGDRIAAGCWDETVRLITPNGRPSAMLTGHSYQVSTLAWSPNGDRLATSGDSTLRLWNRQGIPLHSQKAHDKGIASVAWSRDGNTLATASADSKIKLWSPTGELQKTITLPAPARRVAFGPDNQQLAALTVKTLQRWGVDGTAGPVLVNQRENLAAMAWNPPGDQLAIGGWDKTLQFLNPEGEPGFSQQLSHAILDIAWNSDGTQLALGTWGKKVLLFGADGGKGPELDGHAVPVSAVAFSPDGDKLVSGAFDNTLKFWDVPTAQLEAVTLLFSNGDAATFTPAGQIEHGPLDSLEQELIYLIETTEGKRELLTPSEFERRLNR